MRSIFKSLLIWIAIFSSVLIAWNYVKDSNEPLDWVEFADFRSDVEAGRILDVRIFEGSLEVDLRTGASYATYGTLDDELFEALQENGVYPYQPEEEEPVFTSMFLIWGPVLLIVALWLFFMRRMGGGKAGTNILQLRKSTARVLSEQAKATFADVGGCAEAKEELGDVVSYLRDPKPWKRAGARLPRGILLEGPPGCGKTLLARAVAGETKASFYFVAASEFVEMFVGVGAARVRDLFETATKKAPAVIFIDELDAVGRRRGSGIGASHDEREQTLNQLLVNLDGMERSEGVVVIAATNRPDVLDPALLRAGRMDRRIVVRPYEQEGRRAILEIHTRGKGLHPNVSLDSLAAATHGRSGADLESLVNEATVLAVRRSLAEGGSSEITQADFDRALEKRKELEKTFDRLDLVLIESATQLSEPSGTARARIVLDDGVTVEGQPLWADASFLKILDSDGNPRVIAKRQIRSLEALEGTEQVGRGELAASSLAARVPGMA